MTLQACVTLPSCLASSNSPTFALITLRSVIVMTVTPVVRPWRCAPHWLRAPASGPTDSIRPSDRVKTSTLEGSVIGRCMQRHRHEEFIRFLNAVEREVPAGKVIEAIVDNYATH